ncbi:MAG: aspartate aminotransferase family protein [Candidatus Hodarchaeales archaeon]
MNYFKQELERFLQARPKSKKLWNRSIQVLPGGISHNIRNLGLPLIGAFPVFIQSAHDAYIVDVDEIEYVDFWCGHFAMILGHNHPTIQKVLQEELENGWHFGTTIENQVNLAETLIQDNKGLEDVRFCTSGTESTMYATRLARAYTGKRLVAKAKMGWHGPNDTLLYNVKAPFTGRESPGILSEDQAGILSFEMNNYAFRDLIKAHSKELAAVVLEPVLGGGGGFPVDHEFLKMLREETERFDILLIFDEIITGYRFTYGLFQNPLKIWPDITTMGKIVGGGMPIGAVGGRKDIIGQANPAKKNHVLIGGGTFSANPLSMVAGLKTLEILKGSSLDYQRINKAGTRLLTELNKFFQDNKLKFVATGYKSMILLHVLSEWVENPNPNQIIALTDHNKEALTQLALLNRNINGMHGIGALSLAHTPHHIHTTQETLEEIGDPISQQ